MIEVERMNGSKMLINQDLIQLIEVTPDTMVTFSNGEKVILKTKPAEIVQRIIEFKRKASLPQIQG